MASEHPKITAYIPQEILKALDGWKQAHALEPRSAAIVTIHAGYWAVPHPAPLQDTVLNNLLTELSQPKERVAALEQHMGTAPQATPSTVTEPDKPSHSDMLYKAPSTVLTQTALANRLGCPDQTSEKHRKGGSKEQFATWSGDRDPDGVSWT
jgi:hypothetical protein